jgi:hypothetical protein
LGNLQITGEKIQMKVSLVPIVAFFLIKSAVLQGAIREFSECSETQPNTLECQKVDLSLSIEYLYWKIQEDQLYPAIFSIQSVKNGLNKSELTLKNQKFEYTSGFRAAIGYDFPYESYDTKFAWTRIHSSTRVNYSVSDPKDLIAISFFDQTNSDVAHAESIVSHWNLDYDMLDLELGFKCRIGKCFNFRPKIGLKGGWINQTQKLKVNNISLGQPATETVQGIVKRRNDFSGIGPSIGVDLRFAFGPQFGIFSTISGALLYGKFDLKTETDLADTVNNGMSTGPQNTILNNSNHFFSPTVQFMLGGDWIWCLCQNYSIRFGVAYEAQFWWNQMRSNNSIPQVLFVNSPAGGDLMMHGLTLQASIDF